MMHLSYAAQGDGLTIYMTTDINNQEYDDGYHLTASGTKFEQGPD
jgi:hypothetical protein